MAENNFFDEENRKAEEAAQKLEQDLNAGIDAENKARADDAEQAANDSSASVSAAGKQNFAETLAANTAQKNEEELAKIREFGRELNTGTGNTAPGATATYNTEDPAEMTKGLTEALNEMESQPIPSPIDTYAMRGSETIDMGNDEASAPENEGNEEGTDSPIPPTETMRSGDITEDELTSHIASNGPEKPFNPAPGIPNKDPFETARSGTMSMDELANHIAANGPERMPKPMNGENKAVQEEQTDPTDDQTFTGNMQDDGSIITDDTFGNQYKKANYWDSDEHKKEKKELSDTFMNAKSLDEMIDNGGWAIMRYLMRYATGTPQRDYNKRYTKEKKDFIKQGRQAYESDYFTKKGIEQAEYYDLLDAWVQNGAKSSEEIKKFSEKNDILREDGSFDASKMTAKHKEKLGKIMADDPATREAVRDGITLLTGRVAGDSEIEELIKGIAGNDKHVVASFYDNYAGFHKFKAFEKEAKAKAAEEEAKATEEERIRQGQQAGKTPQTGQTPVNAAQPQPAPVNVNATQPQPAPVNVNATQPQPAPVNAAQPQPAPVNVNATQPQPAPVNAPQPQMRAGYTPSTNTAGLNYTNEPIQVKDPIGKFKDQQFPGLGDLPSRARAAIAFSHDVTKGIQKNRADATMLMQFSNNQKVTPNTTGNAFTIDMGRNG